jgi:3-hydroxyacyl-[acyl-carrier-protein] dehydratase
MPPFAGLLLLDASLTPHEYRALLCLDPSSPALDGHFPGLAILPGIGHLALALHGAQVLEGAVRLVSLSAVRFRHSVSPDDTIKVTVARTGAPGTLQFEVRCGDTIASHGRLFVDRNAE